VEIEEVKEGSGGVAFQLSFFVEPRCLQDLGSEAEMFSFGIDTKEGCNLVAPVEYMNELKVQLSNTDSALFYREDLTLLKKVNPEKSFSFDSMHFCAKEPLWEYGAVAIDDASCPFDTVKLGGFLVVGGTCGIALLLAILAKLSSECGACGVLAKVRLLDVLTPLMGVFTTSFDYLWLFYLKANNQHPLHDTLFMAILCNLLLCFVVNAAALRITITTFILDTPWWRKNRKRLRTILIISVFSPRFFRITRSNIGSIDRTHIHFGTPSKMAVVMSNLGLTSLMQDIPLLLVQFWIWLVWRNLAPKVTLLCFLLKAQSLATTAMHHAFSRSQRAAYERVVKLLGVRRLTAGFFDVSAGAGSQAGKSILDGMRTEGGQAVEDNQLDSFHAEEVLDPTKLDPIQAAMYVAHMYEKQEIKDAQVARHEDIDSGSEGSGSQESESNEDAADAGSEHGESNAGPKAKAIAGPPAAGPGGKTLYPSGLYDKMRRFYSQHDPAKLNSIGRGTEPVDEAALDADLKKRFGVGLDSVQ